MVVRILPVLDQANDLIADAFSVAQAFMRYPEDQASARAVIEALRCSVQAQAEGLKPSTLYEYIVGDISAEAFAGYCAGEILLCRLSNALHMKKDESLNKCAYVISEDMKNRKYPDGYPVPYGVAQLKTHWGKYKNVSHLWAAFSIVKDCLGQPSSDNYEEWERNFFLAADTIYLTINETRIINIKDWDPWILPEGFRRIPYKIQVPPPTKWTLGTLSKYRSA